MQPQTDLFKLKWLMLGMLGAIVSSIFCLFEVKYVLWGATSEGTIVDIQQDMTGARRRRVPALKVYFQYRDQSGADHTRSITTGTSTSLEIGQKVQVEYIPGVERSGRIFSYRYMLYIFLGSLLLIAIGIWEVMSAAQADSEPPPRTKKKKRRSLEFEA